MYLHRKHQKFSKEDRTLKNLKYLSIVLAVVALALATSIAQAQAPDFTLAHGNSSLDIWTSTYEFNWFVDGVDQLYEQDWWLGIGGAAPGRLGTLFPLVWAQPAPNMLTASYDNGAGLNTTVVYTLLGGAPGSKTADLNEQLLVTSPGAVKIWEYNDFDLAGTIGGDTATRINPNLIRQTDGVWVMNETVNTGSPAHWEIASYANILNKLQGPGPWDLSDSGSPFGPGDATYAFEWSSSGGSYFVSKDKLITAVPEPMSMLLGLMGLGSVAGFVRLRRK